MLGFLVSFLFAIALLHGAEAQSDASCLPFYNWVRQLCLVATIPFFDGSPIPDIQHPEEVGLRGRFFLVSSLYY